MNDKKYWRHTGSPFNNMTAGRVYEIFYESINFLELYNDNGDLRSYTKKYFELATKEQYECQNYGEDAGPGTDTASYIHLAGSASLANTITFSHKKGEESIIRLAPNGDIFIRGKLIENDKEVVEAMRMFLKDAGYIK